MIEDDEIDAWARSCLSSAMGQIDYQLMGLGRIITHTASDGTISHEWHGGDHVEMVGPYSADTVGTVFEIGPFSIYATEYDNARGVLIGKRVK